MDQATPVAAIENAFRAFLMEQATVDQDNARTACKPLLDALKVRGDLGLIEDDGPRFIPEPVYSQVRERRLAEEHVQTAIEYAGTVP